MSKKKLSFDGIVFSTDPTFKTDQDEQQVTETLAPNQQKLRIKLDTKHRAGKAVTLITGFVGKGNDIETLGKQLKNYCGTGGSVKDGEIIVQGDNRDKILQWLQKNGYSSTRKI